MADTLPFPQRLVWLGRITMILGILDLLRVALHFRVQWGNIDPSSRLHMALVTSMALLAIVAGAALARGRGWASGVSIVAWGAMATLGGIYSWEYLPSYLEQIATRNYGAFFGLLMPHVLCWISVLLLTPFAIWALLSVAETFRPRRRILLTFLALGIAWGSGSYAAIMLVHRATNKLILD